jgi:hypothetical protein
MFTTANIDVGRAKNQQTNNSNKKKKKKQKFVRGKRCFDEGEFVLIAQRTWLTTLRLICSSFFFSSVAGLVVERVALGFGERAFCVRFRRSLLGKRQDKHKNVTLVKPLVLQTLLVINGVLK